MENKYTPDNQELGVNANDSLNQALIKAAGGLITADEIREAMNNQTDIKTYTTEPAAD